MSKIFDSLYRTRTLFILIFAGTVLNALASDILPPGFRPLPLGVHALVGGKVVTKPEESIDNATILIRDGFIVSVGKELGLPADARIWDMKGTTIYAGFIDPYLVLAATNGPIS